MSEVRNRPAPGAPRVPSDNGSASRDAGSTGSAATSTGTGWVSAASNKTRVQTLHARVESLEASVTAATTKLRADEASLVTAEGAVTPGERINVLSTSPREHARDVLKASVVSQRTALTAMTSELELTRSELTSVLQAGYPEVKALRTKVETLESLRKQLGAIEDLATQGAAGLATDPLNSAGAAAYRGAEDQAVVFNKVARTVDPGANYLLVPRDATRREHTVEMGKRLDKALATARAALASKVDAAAALALEAR